MAAITGRLRGLATEREIQEIVKEIEVRPRQEVEAIGRTLADVSNREALRVARELLGLEKASFSEPEAGAGDSPEATDAAPKTPKKAAKATPDATEGVGDGEAYDAHPTEGDAE